MCSRGYIAVNPLRWECCKSKDWRVSMSWWGDHSNRRQGGWREQSQVLTWLGVLVRKHEQDLVDDCDQGRVPEFTFTGVRVPPPLCSPLVFDKFDIQLLSIKVQNTSRDSYRHAPQRYWKWLSFLYCWSLAMASYLSYFKKILELCAILSFIPSAHIYWHIVLLSFQQRYDFLCFYFF